jgi:membrane protein required for colicin V production
MNTLDLIILIILIWGAINGFIKGFVIQSLTLIAIVLGVWAGIHFSYKLTEFLCTKYSWNVKILSIISMISIFIIVLIVAHFLGKLLTSLIHQNILGWFNRIGGIVFGILKMAFILSVCIALLVKLDLKQKLISNEDTRNSRFYKPVEKIAPAILPRLHLEEIKKGLLKG